MLLVIHQGLYFGESVIRKGNHLTSVHGSHFGVTGHQIPLSRELSHLLIFKCILEENLVSRHKVALGVLSRCLLLGFGSLSARLRSATVVTELTGIAGFTAFLAGPSSGGGSGFRSFFALLLILLVLLSHFAVQDVIHALFHFLAEILFGGVFGFFTQSFQKTLGIGRPANHGQDGDREQ